MAHQDNLLLELETLRRENEILSAQLTLKTRHLDLILNHATIVLAAFNKSGIMEMNIGKGLSKNHSYSDVDIEKFHSKLFTFSNADLEKIMPHAMEAVYTAQKENRVTWAETISPTGNVFHASFVPFQNEEGEVEIIYCIAMRWPNEHDIDPAYFFKGRMELPEFSEFEN